MFQPTRDQARRFFFDAWRKHRAGEALEGLERTAVAVALEHPEYHAVLDDPEHYAQQEYFPDMGETNPFLHLSMHLALEEQLSIDQPPGIRQRFDAVAAARGGRHDALHAAIDCLGEMLWRASRDGTPPDALVYLDCLERRRAK
jgi:hypothetical protein